MPHEPTLKQLLFLAYDGPEALFGGAAGGGKTDALLMAALMWADEPGYTAVLFRRTYADLSLPGALMDRAADWLGGTEARWNGHDKKWTFPSGATLSFGYLDSANDHYRYQGMEAQFIAFDELTQFEERQYLYLFSRLRRLQDSKVPIRMRAASNPGGIGHGWVKERFLESLLFSRVFVPSRLEDNPHLDRDQYRASLENLDPFTRAQLLSGDWTDYTGGLFRREWFQIVDAAPANLRLLRRWDLAATEAEPGKDPDWTVGALLGKSPEGVYYVLDIRRARASPAGVQSLVKQTADLDGRAVHVRMEQEPGASGVQVIDYYTRLLAGYNFQGERVTGDKSTRAAPLSSQAEAGNVKLVRGDWNKALLEEFETFPFGAHDDIVDSVAGAFNELALARRRELRMY